MGFTNILNNHNCKSTKKNLLMCLRCLCCSMYSTAQYNQYNIYEAINGCTKRPPSTFYSAPVIKPASSEARKVTRLATSSGFPSWPAGILSAISFRASSDNPAFSSKRVSIIPGLITLTLIRYAASSRVSVRPKALRTAFA